jgi:hypothetical protein
LRRHLIAPSAVFERAHHLQEPGERLLFGDAPRLEIRHGVARFDRRRKDRFGRLLRQFRGLAQTVDEFSSSSRSSFTREEQVAHVPS